MIIITLVVNIKDENTLIANVMYYLGKKILDIYIILLEVTNYDLKTIKTVRFYYCNCMRLSRLLKRNILEID